jgi:hypothetical protein
MDVLKAELVAKYRGLAEAWTNARSRQDLIKIYAQINGGKSANPIPLFNQQTGQLKSRAELSILVHDHLKLIFKENTNNSENSVMLLWNVQTYEHDLSTWGSVGPASPGSTMETFFNQDMTLRSQA